MSTGRYLYELPPAVWYEFCRLMDGLADTQWLRFASEVLSDQTDLRLAERRERRTDYVMNQWANRNGNVEELIDLLERQQLLRARDVILTWRAEPVSRPHPQSCHVQVSSTPKPLLGPNSLPTKAIISGDVLAESRRLPTPGPPPSSLQSGAHRLNQAPAVTLTPNPVCGGEGLCWSHDEVDGGTHGFSSSKLVGTGVFGTVYQASMRTSLYAVKRLKQDSSLLDRSLMKKSFETEVEKLCQYRHPNLLQVMGFSVGPEDTFCILSSFMSYGSLQSQLVCGSLSWEQRVGVVAGACRALQFLHLPPPPHLPLIHGNIKSSNILLDQHLVPKLGDFGLGVFSPLSAGGAARTSRVGKTSSLRAAQAYLPQDYLQDGRLTTSLDVFSFGVVLLEVVTGRRPVETEGSTSLYLKDLLADLVESPSLSQTCPSHLDPRLLPHHDASPGGVAGCQDVTALACRCLHKNRKKRPAVTEVLDALQDLLALLRSHASSSLLSLPPPAPPQSVDRLGALVRDMAQLGTLENSSSFSSSSSSSFASASLSQPCESDESVCVCEPCLPPPGDLSGPAVSPASLPHHAKAPSWLPPSSPLQTDEEVHSGCSAPEESDELDFLS